VSPKLELPPLDSHLELSYAAWYVGILCITHPETVADRYRDYRIILKYDWRKGWSLNAYSPEDDELCFVFGNGEFHYLSASAQHFKTYPEAMQAYREFQKKEFVRKF